MRGARIDSKGRPAVQTERLLCSMSEGQGAKGHWVRNVLLPTVVFLNYLLEEIRRIEARTLVGEGLAIGLRPVESTDYIK